MRSSPSTAFGRCRPSLAVALAMLLAAAGPVAADPVTPAAAERLDHLVRHDCGSCHGMTLQGGLGPSLLAADLRDRDEDGLVQIILHGNPANAMPPWGDLLSESEARWIVRRLMAGAGYERKVP